MSQYEKTWAETKSCARAGRSMTCRQMSASSGVRPRADSTHQYVSNQSSCAEVATVRSQLPTRALPITAAAAWQFRPPEPCYSSGSAGSPYMEGRPMAAAIARPASPSFIVPGPTV